MKERQEKEKRCRCCIMLTVLEVLVTDLHMAHRYECHSSTMYLMPPNNTTAFPYLPPFHSLQGVWDCVHILTCYTTRFHAYRCCMIKFVNCNHIAPVQMTSHWSTSEFHSPHTADLHAKRHDPACHRQSTHRMELLISGTPGIST